MNPSLEFVASLRGELFLAWLRMLPSTSFESQTWLQTATLIAGILGAQAPAHTPIA